MDDDMTEKEKDEETIPRKGPDILPSIRVDGEVADDEPHIEIGKRKASLPSPIPFNPREE
jgi:hypothetical protein